MRPGELNLSEDIRKKIEAHILKAIRTSEDELKSRNDMIVYLRDLAFGRPGAVNLPYRGGCEINSTIVREAVVTVSSFLDSVLSRTPPIIVSSNHNDAGHEEEDYRRQIETFITNTFETSGFFDEMYQTIQDGITLPYAVSSISWDIDTEKEIITARIGEDTGRAYEQDEEAEAEELLGEPQQYVREVGVSEGVSYSPVNPLDFFYWPPTASKIDNCESCGHRIWITTSQLYDLIDKMGLDKENVEKAIIASSRGASTYGKDYREDVDKESISPPDGSVEIWIWYTKMPILVENDEIITPEDLIGSDLMCVVDKQTGLALSLDFSPFQAVKPYVTFSIFRQAHLMEGMGLAEMLEDMQELCSAEIRLYVDAASFRTAPAVKVRNKLRAKDLGVQEVRPGGILYVDEPDDITPLQMAGTQEAMQVASYAETHADKLYAAGGVGTLSSKVRKNNEIQAQQSSAFSKLNFWKRHFQAGMRDLAKKMIQIHEHLSTSEQVLVDSETGETLKLSNEALKKDYTLHPYADERNADPDKRIETSEAISKHVQEYWALAGNPQMPIEAKRAIYKTNRRLLQDLGIHNPKEFIGNEPKAQANQVQPGQNQPGNPAGIQYPFQFGGAQQPQQGEADQQLQEGEADQ